MKNKKKGDASFLIGLVLGMVIGAGLAMVLTPNSGEENRAKLMGAASDAKDSLVSKAGEAKDSLMSKGSEAKDKLQSTADETKARVQGASEGAAQ